MYTQIFRPFKWLRYSSYAGAIVTVLFYFSILIAILAFTVLSPGQTWAEHWQTPRETKGTNVTIHVGSVHLAIDAFIVILPIFGVSMLQPPLRTEIGVMAVFFRKHPSAVWPPRAALEAGRSGDRISP